MTYWRYWQLNSAPFTAPFTPPLTAPFTAPFTAPSNSLVSGSPLFRGASVEEALARIEFMVSNRRSVASLTGVSGVGKSALLQYCAAHPPIGTNIPSLEMIRVSLLGLSSGELLCNLAIKLAGHCRISDPLSAWKSICDYFQAARREGTQTVLLIDDIESATTSVETDLTRLMAMSFPLTVVFAVETKMASVVSRSIMDRCELQIELPPWEIAQSDEFLNWMSISLGRPTPIFTDEAVERIQELSQGIARRIVHLADLSLVAGAVAQADCVDVDCIEQVACELPKSTAA